MTPKKSTKTAKSDIKHAPKTPENSSIDEKVKNEPVQKPEQEMTQESTDVPNGPEMKNVEAEFSENDLETPKSDNETETESGEAIETAEAEQGPENKSDIQNEPAGDPETENDQDPEPEVEASLRANQCPRCKHVSGPRAFVFPSVNRQSVSGVWNGKAYQIIETRRVKCEKCGQVHFIKTYK